MRHRRLDADECQDYSFSLSGLSRRMLYIHAVHRLCNTEAANNQEVNIKQTTRVLVVIDIENRAMRLASYTGQQ